MIDLDLQEMRSWFGFGVAGNFAGHLEQAGEDADFVNVVTEGVEKAQRPRASSRGTHRVRTPSWASSRCRPTRSCCPNPLQNSRVRSTCRSNPRWHWPAGCAGKVTP